MEIQKNANWWANLMERHNLQALELDGRIIFQTYFKDVMESSGLVSPS